MRAGRSLSSGTDQWSLQKLSHWHSPQEGAEAVRFPEIYMWRELCMENFKSHKREIFWYNIHVPRERSSTLFDIGGRHPAPAIGPKPVWADGKTPVGRNHRVRRSRELRKRIRRPLHVRNISVLVLPRKPLLSRTRQEYGVAPHGNHAAQPLFLCFVQARSGTSRKQGFEGAPLFFSASKRRHTLW